MAVTIAFRSENVGPVCKRIAALDDRIRVVHEDSLTPQMVTAQRTIVQPTPTDPLINLWDAAQDSAEAFSNLQITRSQIARDGIAELQQRLGQVTAAMQVPAPVAPPPTITERQVLIRWGSRWPGQADITINTAEAISLARNKAQSRLRLNGICPLTWQRRLDVHYPAVVRPRRHHGGERFFVVNNRPELERAVEQCGPGWYASQLIDKTNEYRVFVLQGRVVCVSERFPASTGEVAWNLAAGGRLINVKRRAWPIGAIKVAIEAARRIDLDFSAVDVAVDRNGRALVFEVNTAPGLRNSYTLEQVSWAFGSLVNGNTPPALNLASELTWQQVIHPSLVQTADTTDGN